jgi:CHAD domain-containing protein
MDMNLPTSEGSKPDVTQLLQASLDERWKKYGAELKRCQEEFSNEAVHDLRVATRRILALVGLLRLVFPGLRVRKLRRTFKDQLDEFDNLRDTQVILEEISKTEQDLPQLQTFQQHLKRREKKRLRTLHKKVKKFKISKLEKRLRKLNRSVESEARDDTEARVLQAVDDSFARVQERLKDVDSDRPATIHRVRVAFKSFRYMVEIARPLLKDFPETNFEQMDRYQTLMGDVQDSEVFLETFADFSEDASPADVEPVRRYIERRQADAIAAYREQMSQLSTFWRAAPDQPFPWEKTS